MTNTSAVRDPFSALGDSTRRAVFERIARSPAAVGDIAKGMPVSRPAVSQHLKILKSAGLVTEEVSGTRRIYRIDPRGIGAMRDRLDGYWRQALTAFAAFADDDDSKIEE
ncbi:MAG: metalloregulator ArsR/SmtB family transcription factor [Sphingomicrobium sp.]